MFPLRSRVHGWFQIRSARTALVLLTACTAFVSGFGVPAAGDPDAGWARAHVEDRIAHVSAPAPTSNLQGTRESASESARAAAAMIAPPRSRATTVSAAGPLELRSGYEDGVRPNSRVVAEYAPISIESLPLHTPDEGAADWRSTANLKLVTTGVLRSGQSLSGELRRQGIDSATIHLIAREMSPVFNFRRSRPGDRYRLGQDPEGMVLDFRYSTRPETSYSLHWDRDHYEVSQDVATLRSQLAKVSGLIESSLYDAVKDLGEQPLLASEFADIFAWDIDFSRSVRPGDDFQILYERMYGIDDDGDEVYVKPGRILAARYNGSMGVRSAVYFERDDGRGGYYRPDGSSIERAFLMAPLEFSRISSSFSRARQHPILKVVRPHPGIDYAAAEGTALWAIGDGTVIYLGWAGASGNLVKIQHMNGYVSSYAHLSRFHPELEVGQDVKQKQSIGFVGDTGLATGPHVCFRMQQHGHYVNPLEIASPAGESIEREAWKSFQLRRDLLLGDLGSSTLVAADEAL